MAEFEDFESFKAVMSKEEIFDWFQRRLNRQPEAPDVYKVAKEFYQLGAYSRALSCLLEYITLPGCALQGRHLLGYCYLNLNQNERALREFKKCAKEGFADDWQLVVELIIENEQKRRRYGGGEPTPEAVIETNDMVIL